MTGTERGGSDIRVVVFDLDGVLRHFDRDAEAALEARYGVERGALLTAAFGDELGRSLVRGKIGWDVYTDELRRRLPAGLVDEFVAMRARLDHDALALVDRLRDGGRRVCILTNGSERTMSELDEHGITDRFDTIFNAAEIGIAKPDPAVYEVVTERLDCPPDAVAFVDDREDNVDAARQVGWNAHVYTDLAGVRQWLDSLVVGD